jgi:hypothetical protein
LDLAESDYNHTCLGHKKSLQEVSLNVSDLSVGSEFVNGISDLSILSVVKEILKHLQGLILFVGDSFFL